MQNEKETPRTGAERKTKFDTHGDEKSQPAREQQTSQNASKCECPPGCVGLPCCT